MEVCTNELTATGVKYSDVEQLVADNQQLHAIDRLSCATIANLEAGNDRLCKALEKVASKTYDIWSEGYVAQQIAREALNMEAV